MILCCYFGGLLHDVRICSSCMQCSWNWRPWSDRFGPFSRSRPSYVSGRQRWKHPVLTLTSPQEVCSVILTLLLPLRRVHRARAPRTRSSQPSFTPARKARTRPRTRTSPPPLPPVFEVSTRNRFSPLREAERDAVVIGDLNVRHVHATTAKGKVRSHCFPGARVLDVAAQIPAILNGAETIGAVVLHAGVNDTRLRQTEVLKQDFRSLIETVRSHIVHIARDEDHRVRTASDVPTRI